jgi:hypothetical protein
VNAIANSGAPDAIDRAEEIVSKVEKMEHIKVSVHQQHLS